LRGFEHRIVRARVEPSVIAAQHLYIEQPLLKNRAY
jgi:hypothetical protein